MVILHLELTLFDSSLSPLGLRLDLVSTLDHFYVFLVVVLLLFEVVDLFDEFNILLHKALVNLFMRFISLCKRTSQVVYILLQILP